MSWPSNSARTKDWNTEVLTDTDLEMQFDILHQYFVDSLNGSTGHIHSGGTNDAPPINLTVSVTGTLPVANGGTGVATLASLLGLIYPVGSIYSNAINATNPATLLGFGTWTAIGGFLAGLDGSTEFLTAGQTGGAKTVNSAHTHPITISATNGSGVGTLEEGAGTPNRTEPSATDSGGSSALAILPPYTVCYFWKRTA